MTETNRSGGGKHRRPDPEGDVERTQRFPELQQVVDDWLTEWPTTDLDRG
jgi:hypothetical protein